MMFRAGSRRTCRQKSWHSDFDKEKASQSEAKEVLPKDPKKCEVDKEMIEKRSIGEIQKCESSLGKSQGKVY